EFLGIIQYSVNDSLISKSTKKPRISVKSKIPKNGLDKISTRIRNIQSNLFALDKSMVYIVPSPTLSNIYDTIRNNIIQSYQDLSPTYESIDLYSRVLDESYKKLNLNSFHENQYRIVYEFFLIKLFEECTIFES